MLLDLHTGIKDNSGIGGVGTALDALIKDPGREDRMTDELITPEPPGVTKICRICCVEKSIGEFAKRRDSHNCRNDCKECRAAKGRQYNALNRDKIRANKITYHQENHERIKANDARYATLNKERRRQWHRDWTEANRDALREKCRARRSADLEKARAKEAEKRNSPASKAYMAAYREKGREKARAATKAWNEANPDHARALRRNRKARIRGASGSHTKDDIAFLFKTQGGKCAHAWCRVGLKNGRHIDHIIPISRGGSNDRRNLQLLCAPCNLSKSNRHPIEFAQSNGLLL